MSSVRFHDPGLTEHHFRDSVLVRCPRCDRIAHHERACVVCRSCGLSRSVGQGFWPALWLRAETRHGELWAYNLAHLDLIRRFVAADLRERDPWYCHGRKMTCVGRLPAWVKSRKNRTEVLRAIDRLRVSVIEG
ncbi:MULTISPECIES: hypothetical protein [unclassified Streptomyces]|uniref:hypothetical protein n=1 Tax=unclassified Streptomyces TaxID=2593676 RepID=UPI0016619832|nr:MULTISPECIES: hypothetical protein [unclassified Streptomyces]MBD0839684.1 hypothetical protein [Streptomyces sp. TRM68416]